MHTRKLIEDHYIPLLTWYVYICSLRGFYHNHAANLRAVTEAPTEELLAEIMNELMESSTEYLKAANYYPIDDEKHACESPMDAYVRP